MILQFCTLNGNSAGFDGGGIYNTDATLALQNSIFDNNPAPSYGGGIFNYGATLMLQNSTFSRNSAGRGGGIHNFGPGGSSALELENCTLNGNSAADEGGGILNYAATLRIAHTLLAKGVSGENYAALFNASVTNLGYNLSDNVSTAAFATSYPNLFLGPLMNNGGPTLTHALLPGSPAVDAGDPDFTGPPYDDQRGSGFPRVFNGTIDIGALEAQTIMPFAPVLEHPAWFGVGSNFGFAFKNVAGATFSVLATTNLALPLSNWTVLGRVIEFAPGQYQVTEPQDTKSRQKYYHVSSP